MGGNCKDYKGYKLSEDRCVQVLAEDNEVLHVKLWNRMKDTEEANIYGTSSQVLNMKGE